MIQLLLSADTSAAHGWRRVASCTCLQGSRLEGSQNQNRVSVTDASKHHVSSPSDVNETVGPRRTLFFPFHQEWMKNSRSSSTKKESSVAKQPEGRNHIFTSGTPRPFWLRARNRLSRKISPMNRANLCIKQLGVGVNPHGLTANIGLSAVRRLV